MASCVQGSCTAADEVSALLEYARRLPGFAIHSSLAIRDGARLPKPYLFARGVQVALERWHGVVKDARASATKECPRHLALIALCERVRVDDRDGGIAEVARVHEQPRVGAQQREERIADAAARLKKDLRQCKARKKYCNKIVRDF